MENAGPYSFKEGWKWASCRRKIKEKGREGEKSEKKMTQKAKMSLFVMYFIMGQGLSLRMGALSVNFCIQMRKQNSL